jgi:hypothetical protein
VRKGGKRSYSWEEVDHLEFVAMEGRAGGRAGRGHRVTTHFLDIHLRDQENPPTIGLSHLRGNSLELADQIEQATPVPFERVDKTAGLPLPDPFAKDV